MQISIEERKFKAEREWEEITYGMLEQEQTIKMEKLNAETKWLQLNVDKELWVLKNSGLSLKWM